MKGEISFNEGREHYGVLMIQAYLFGGGPAEELGTGKDVVRQVDNLRRHGEEGAVVDVAQVVLAEVGQHNVCGFREEEGTQRLQVVVVGAKESVGREQCQLVS